MVIIVQALGQIHLNVLNSTNTSTFRKAEVQAQVHALSFNCTQVQILTSFKTKYKHKYMEIFSKVLECKYKKCTWPRACLTVYSMTVYY